MGSFIDNRDGQIYKTVVIGAQTWMAQNLNYAYNESTSSLDSSSFCFGDDPNNCDTYGRLYLWSAAMDSAGVFSSSGKGCGEGKTCSPSGTVQGVCPEGWHLPSKVEWDTLFTNVGGTSSAGRMLKSEDEWPFYSESTEGVDPYGFSALPAGYRYGSGNFSKASSYAYFWSSTEDDNINAYSENFDYYDSGVSEGGSYKYNAFSVRCLRN